MNLASIPVLFFFFFLFFASSTFCQEGIFYISTGQQLDSAQIALVIPDTFDLFGSDDVLHVTIESDFKNLVKRKFKNEYQPALLHFQLNDSIISKREIRIKPRGEFRKKYCSFPPIKVNFKKSNFTTDGVMQLEKMKMVTKCRSSKMYESYILKEYLIYKLFNLLTDKSFKARLLNVKYIDTGRQNRMAESYAFVIEGNKSLSTRNNAFIMDSKNLNQTHMHDKHMTMVAMFMFMIGNTDWSVPGPHNVKILKVLELSEPAPYPVPYDFDYCGLVDAEYAIPTEGLGIKSVKSRVFQGYCKTEEEYIEVINLFLEKEQAMYDLVSDFSILPKEDKKDFLSYLEEFFRMLHNPKRFLNIAEGSCKQ